jgi:hypothetical protein
MKYSALCKSSGENVFQPEVLFKLLQIDKIVFGGEPEGKGIRDRMMAFGGVGGRQVAQ